MANKPGHNIFARRFVLLLLIVVGTGVILAAYGFLIEPDRLVVNKHQISPKGLDNRLDGLRLVVISDLHGGSNFVDQQKLLEIVKIANDQEPDFVFILGDFVSQVRSGESNELRPLKMPMKRIAESISGLRARFGVFAVEGNHDYWYGSEKVVAALEEVGIRVLVDELIDIKVNGTYLSVFGMKDHMKVRSYSTYKSQIEPSLEKAKGDLLILSHAPDVAEYITGDNLISSKLRLFLAGHTHGGQVWLPIIGSPMVPSSFGQRFSYGPISYRGTEIFVTSGIGTSILPVRFLMPPEIAVLTLRSN